MLQKTNIALILFLIVEGLEEQGRETEKRNGEESHDADINVVVMSFFCLEKYAFWRNSNNSVIL